MAVKHMLPAVPEAADTLMAYDLTHQALQQFIVNTHTEWFNTIDNSISKQLQNSLLSQDKANGESCSGVGCFSSLWSCTLKCKQTTHAWPGQLAG